MNLTIKVTIFIIVFGLTLLPAQNKTVETSGDILLFTIPAAAFGTTLIINDSEGTWQFTKSLLLTGVLTYGLKFALNKERPDKSDDNAFPSGHTSTTFQSASFIAKRYGLEYGIPAYLLAGYTAFTRLHAKKHDGLDILGGIVIGVGSTYLFTTRYQEEDIEMTFNKTDGGFLIGFSYKF